MFHSLNLGRRDTSRLGDDASGIRTQGHVFVCLQTDQCTLPSDADASCANGHFSGRGACLRGLEL